MLTQAHVRALRDHPSPFVRADIATAVSHDFATERLSSAEKDIAEQILEELAQDVASLVRQALADQIRSCPFLPHHIAVTLAHDLEESIALPVIEASPLLSDADLIRLVRESDSSRQMAVARRKAITEAIADALVATEKHSVVQTLLSNKNASISDKSLLKVAIKFRREAAIEILLIDRSLLPFSVCAVLMSSVSTDLRARLVEKHQIPDFMAKELVTQGREKVLADILPSYDTEPSQTLAFMLHQKNLLTPTLLLRTLCFGDLRFFESGISVLAGTSIKNTQTLLYDDGTNGFKALYRKADLTIGLFPFFRICVDAVLHGHLDQGKPAYMDHVISKFLAIDRHLSLGNIDEIVAQLAHRPNFELITESINCAAHDELSPLIPRYPQLD